MGVKVEDAVGLERRERDGDGDGEGEGENGI